jgi:hypothetical protein
MSFSVFVIFLQLVFLASFPTPSLSSYNIEHAALLDLFTSLSGSSWASYSYWTETFLSHCEWHGVGCTSEQLVSSLQLPNNNLAGTLSISSLLLFPYLHTLNLAQNPNLVITNFSANSPLAFAYGPRLQTLILRDCNLSFPLFHPKAHFPALSTLLIQNNRFDADLSFVKMQNFAPNLEVFWADDNLLSGTLTDVMLSFPNLHQLSLANNRLAGSFSEIPQQLLYLNLANNPTLDDPTFSDLVSLQTTDLALTHLIIPNVSLRGDITAAALLQLPNLKVLRLEKNHIMDPFPFDKLALLTDLAVFIIYDNDIYSFSRADEDLFVKFGVCPTHEFKPRSVCAGYKTSDIRAYSYDHRNTGLIMLGITLLLTVTVQVILRCELETGDEVFDDMTQLSHLNIEY